MAEICLRRALSFEPEAVKTDGGRKTMIENIKEKTSDEVKLPASRKIYVETNGQTANHHKHHLRVELFHGLLHQYRSRSLKFVVLL